MVNNQEAVIQFAIELVGHRDFKAFAAKQKLGVGDTIDAAKVSEWVNQLVGPLDIDLKDRSLLTDFVELMMFISSRRGYLNEFDIGRIQASNYLLSESLLRRQSTVVKRPA